MENKMQIILPGELIESILEGIEAKPSSTVLINALVAKLLLVNERLKKSESAKKILNLTVTELNEATFN